MDKKNFEILVEKIMDAPLPDCPASLETNVLRRIRVSADGAGLSMLDWVLALISRPGFVLTALALTIAVSSSMTIFSSQFQPDPGQSEIVASRALGFDVFQRVDFFDIDKN